MSENINDSADPVLTFEG